MDVSAAQHRLIVLERRLRRMQVVVVLLVAAASGALLLGTTPLSRVFDEVRAQRFILQNELAQTRGIWESADGQASLTLFDVNLRPRLRIQVSDDDRSEVQFLDKQQQVALAMYARGDESSLVIFDGERKARLVAGRDGNVPHVSLLDPSEAVRMRMQAVDKEAKLLLFDDSGRERFQLYTLGDMAGLGVKDDAGRQRIIISEIPGDGPVILMRDGDRKTIFQAP
jgi:hypothetical protein